MNNTRWTLPLALAALAGLATSARAASDDRPQPAAEQFAERRIAVAPPRPARGDDGGVIVEIRPDEAAAPVVRQRVTIRACPPEISDDADVLRLMSLDKVRADLAKKHNLPAADVVRSVRVEGFVMTSAGEGAPWQANFDLIVESARAGDPSAAAVAAALIRELATATAEVGARELRAGEMRLAEVQARTEQLRNELEERRVQLSRQVDIPAATIQSVQLSAERLQVMREALSIDLKARQARSRALAEILAQTRVAAEDRGRIQAQLADIERQIVAESIAYKQLAEKFGAEAARPPAQKIEELRAAAAKLTESLRRVEPDGVARLAADLRAVAVDIVEMEARLIAVEERLKAISSARDDVRRVADLESRLSDAHRTIQSLREELAAERRAARELPRPAVLAVPAPVPATPVAPPRPPQ